MHQRFRYRKRIVAGCFVLLLPVLVDGIFGSLIFDQSLTESHFRAASDLSAQVLHATRVGSIPWLLCIGFCVVGLLAFWKWKGLSAVPFLIPGLALTWM